MTNAAKPRYRSLMLAILVTFVTSSCVRHRPVGPQIQGSLYATGLRALHEGTPDGYLRAATAFRGAADISPENCSYSLNLAQALLLLAEEQRLNWEEFESTRSEAIARVELDRCSDDRSLATRVRALMEYPQDSAADTIENAMRFDPQDPMNWVVYWKLSPNDSGGPAIERPEELDLTSALVQWEVGRLYRRRGESERAAESFGRALVLNPGHYRAYLGLGHLALEDESSTAETQYGHVVRLAPDFLEGRLAFGNYFSAADEGDAAIFQYQAAIDSNPNYHPAHFSLGTLLLDIDRPDEAEPHFREVVRIDESNADAYYYLGNIQYVRKRYGWAQIQYELALAWDPDHFNAEYGFGKASQELGELDEALGRYERVINLAPRFPDAYFSRGSIRSLREEYEDAVRDYGTATSVGEQEILQTDARIRAASARPSRIARAQSRRLEEYKSHLEELMSYTGQNRTAVETYLRELEQYRQRQER